MELPAQEQQEETHATKAKRTRRKPAAEQPSREPGDDTATEPAKKPFFRKKGHAHDNAAGVEIMDYDDSSKKPQIHETWLRFRDGKPSEEVRQVMKEAGFHWSPDAPKGGGNFDVEGAWAKKIGFETRSEDRYVAEKTYHTVRNMMRQEKGIEPDTIGQPAF